MASEHLERITIRSLKALHDWLSKQHDSGKSVWLITGKKHTGHYLDYNDIIDELLCWGWVDSRTLKVDDDWRGLLIAPRNPGLA